MTVSIEPCFQNIANLPIFRGLCESTVRNLVSKSKVKILSENDHLFDAGDSADFFGYVLEGYFKLSYFDTDGEEVIMHFAGYGEALGVMSVMKDNVNFPFSAIAKSDCKFLLINRESFFSTWMKNSELMFRFQSDLQGRLFKSYDEKRVQRQPLNSKIASLLIYLSQFKSTSNDKIEISITRREISSFVGSSHEAVIRVMSAWRARGIIDTEDRIIHIKDIAALINETNSCPEGSKNSESGLTAIWAKSSLNTKQNIKSVSF